MEIPEGAMPRQAVIGVLRPSVPPGVLDTLLEPSSVMCMGGTQVPEAVANLVACSCHGLSLAQDLLKYLRGTSVAPSRAAVLSNLGIRASHQMRLAAQCLLFRDYDSFFVLLRAAMDHAAMMEYLAKHEQKLKEWVHATAAGYPDVRTPAAQRKSNQESIRGIVDSARRAYTPKYDDIAERSMRWLYNATVHPDPLGSELGLMFALHDDDATLSEGVLPDDRLDRYLYRDVSKLLIDSAPVSKDDERQAGQMARTQVDMALHTLMRVWRFTDAVKVVASATARAELLSDLDTWLKGALYSSKEVRDALKSDNWQKASIVTGVVNEKLLRDSDLDLITDDGEAMLRAGMALVTAAQSDDANSRSPQDRSKT